MSKKINNNIKESKCESSTKDKEDDIMSAITRNYVYEIKAKKDDEKNEKTVSKAILAMCKEVASKYTKK